MVFCPYRPYPLFRRLAPWPFVWLGCWSASCTLALDTEDRIPDVAKLVNWNHLANQARPEKSRKNGRKGRSAKVEEAKWSGSREEP